MMVLMFPSEVPEADDSVLGGEPALVGSTLFTGLGSGPEAFDDVKNAYQAAQGYVREQNWQKVYSEALAGLSKADLCRTLLAQDPIRYEQALHFLCLRAQLVQCVVRWRLFAVPVECAGDQCRQAVWQALSPHAAVLDQSPEFFAIHFPGVPDCMIASMKTLRDTLRRLIPQVVSV